MSETDVVTMMKWGTWEELLLGGAVLRHGTLAWDAVAAEIRSRTLYPFFFTAEVCKAKYEDLRERYCGCNAWFEELRKRRVAELKRELEKSADSIGSLETKLESLKGEKIEEEEEEEDCNVKYDDSNRTESPVSDGSTERIEFSGKETSNSKDGLSAGSFTEEIRTTTWSLEQNQTPAATESTQETEIIKSEEEMDEKKTTTSCLEIIGGNLRKRRGKRKRKDCSNTNQINLVKEVKEGSVGDSDVFRTAAPDHVVAAVVDTRERDCCDRAEPMARDDREKVDLLEILNLFIENEKENAAVFRCRLDSQKRARYKKTIRCHMDFHRLRSRINDRSITTDRELFRDLLLLSNNALVFYPKTSQEFVAAMSLRELAVKTFRRQDRSVSTRDSGVDGSCGRNDDGAAVVVIESQACNPPPVKLPRSVRPRNRKVVRKVVNSIEETPLDKKVVRKIVNSTEETPLDQKVIRKVVNSTEEAPLDQKIEITKKEPCEIEDIPLVDSLPLVASKKSRVRAGKVGGRSGPKRAETSPVKGKKKARRR